MKTPFRQMSLQIYSITLASVLTFTPWVHAQGTYFQGKTIRVVRGGQPGDLFDLWTRHIATYFGKYIPGHPSVMVQNMPGAGSVIAANYVYGVAKPDGLTLGWIGPTLYFDQMVGRKEVKYDWAKYTFIGSPSPSEHHLYMRSDSPYKTIEDVRKASEPPKELEL